MAPQLFSAVPNDREAARRRSEAYSWVPKSQLVAGFFLVTSLLYYGWTTDGWFARIAPGLGLMLLYWLLSHGMWRINKFTEDREKDIEGLRRQMVEFVAAVHSGSVEPKVLRRLKYAAMSDLHAGRPAENGLTDDWSLIGRSWRFWENGFDEQDSTRCIHCAQERRRHVLRGQCPATPIDAA
jgi:hypothetical protein